MKNLAYGITFLVLVISAVIIAGDAGVFGVDRVMGNSGDPTPTPTPVPTPPTCGPAALDQSFGTNGKVTTGGPNPEEARSIAIQSDGKIVVAGSGTGSNTDFSVARYLANGTLDTSFGGTGFGLTDLQGNTDNGMAVAIQSDGKILMTGDSTGPGGFVSFATVRYLSDGSLDATFGTGGKVITQFTPGLNFAKSVVVQPNGKIIVAGHVQNPGLFDFGIVRYEANGTLDTTFGIGGKVITDLLGSHDFALSAKLQADGKIVVSGQSRNGTDWDFAAVRYNVDGSLDATFNGTGKATADVSGPSESVSGSAIQPDGKIIIVGMSANGSDYDLAMVRFGAGGTLDPTFGSGGKVNLNIGNDNNNASSVEVQSDGKLIVAGITSNGTDNDFTLHRFNSDGTLDLTFNGSGMVAVDFQNSFDTPNAVAIQPNGKVVLAGSTIVTNFDYALARFGCTLTGANVSVSGRVMTAGNQGIRNAIVSLTDSAGNMRQVHSSSLGYYRFDDVTAGETYVLSIRSKRYTFENPSRIVMIFDDVTDGDFIANE